MEFYVGVDVALWRIDGLSHLVDLKQHRFHIVGTGALRRETGHLDLQDLAYLQELPQRLRLYAQEQTERVTYSLRTSSAKHRPAPRSNVDASTGLHQARRGQPHAA